MSQIDKNDDVEVWNAINKEFERQRNGLELIASENYASVDVMRAQGSVLTNKYAEGYPGKRYYGGCEFVDEVERIAISRACKLFECEAANVQPHSGSQANMAVYLAELKAGDTILGMDLSHGGHLTHGSPVNFSGILFKAETYKLNQSSERIDYDELMDRAREVKPKLLIAGYSAYSRRLEFDKFKEIADAVGALLLVDMAHFSGLVAGGVHPSPLGYADYVTTTTHKTLRGPRGGLILGSEERIKKANSKIFPGIQGGPLEHVIAAKAVAFGEALKPSFRNYCLQVVENARAMANVFLELGLKLVSGGTDNHLMLLDLSSEKLTGKEAEHLLDLAGITVNKNTVPNEKRSPFVTSGIRIGTPAMTTRGLGQKEVSMVARWIVQILRDHQNEKLIHQVRNQVLELCQQFPIYKGLHSSNSVNPVATGDMHKASE